MRAMMEPTELRSRLSGVIAFPVTPFRNDLMKAMMDMVGLHGGPVRSPLVEVRPEERDARYAGELAAVSIGEGLVFRGEL